MIPKKIDVLEAKMLKELLNDGRKSFAELAKDLQVTSATISDHFRKLEESGVIVGATLQYNCSVFGYKGLATLLLNVESQYVNEVFERIQKTPNAYPKRQYNVEHNIMVITAWKSLRDLDIVKETIRRQNPIVECKTYLWTDVRNTPENLTLGLETETNHTVLEKLDRIKDNDMDKAIEVDAIDMQIIGKLIKNGRLPFRKIAQEIGISTDTVSKRYAKLREHNLIKATIQISPIALGYEAIVDFSLAFTTQEEINTVIDKLLQIPNVSYIVKVEGDFDLHVNGLVKNLPEIFKMNEEITKIPNIKKLEAALRKSPPEWPSPGQQISTFGKGII